MVLELARKWRGKFRQERASREYHQTHTKEADRILKCIEHTKGPLDSAARKASDEYAKQVLGWEGYAPWLYVYSAMAGGFKEGWIPDNYYGEVVVPRIKGEYGKVSDLKSLAKRLFGSELFPDIACQVNGYWYSRDWRWIPETELTELVFRDSEKVVFKIDNSLQGLGVFFFERRNFNLVKIRALGNGVLQSYIQQHADLDELMPASVSTLRVTTALDECGVPFMPACYLRVGRGVDTHVKSESHVRVPIDLETGELSEFGYTTQWTAIKRHPDSEVPFGTRRIPHFEECRRVALELHAAMPLARCIGWDITVDVHGRVQIMEWNGGHNDIKFSEATQGPCFTRLGWEKFRKN